MSTLKNEAPGDKFLFSIPREWLWRVSCAVLGALLMSVANLDIAWSLLKVCGLGLASATAAMVVSKSLLFESWVKKTDLRWSYVGYALKCTFCLAGWLLLPINIFYAPEFIVRSVYMASLAFGFNMFRLPNILLGWLISWAIATLFYLLIWESLEKYAPKMRVNYFVRKR